MSPQHGIADNTGFVTNEHYTFDPPVETNCASLVPNSPWIVKTFAEGQSLGYRERVRGYLFRGKPVGESAEFVFVVAWGKGSVANTIPPSKLRAVE